MERVNQELDDEMAKAWGAVRDAWERAPEATWRDAASIVALERHSEAQDPHGLWP